MSLPNPTPQATVELQHAMKAAIDNGRRILIVGCPPGTFPHWMTRHESLLFWPSSEAKVSDDRRMVPAEVAVVLVTRMLSHALSNNVRQQAKERALACPADTFSPGAVHRLLDGIVDRTKRSDSMARITEVRRTPDPEPAGTINEEGAQLVETIDDAIAALQLVRERVLAFGARFAAVEEQLDTLNHLKKLLQK